MSKIIHGIECEKVVHIGSGYLHAENDDAPFEVDGAIYCGRCHFVLPKQEAEAKRLGGGNVNKGVRVALNGELQPQDCGMCAEISTMLVREGDDLLEVYESKAAHDLCIETREVWRRFNWKLCFSKGLTIKKIRSAAKILGLDLDS